MKHETTRMESVASTNVTEKLVDEFILLTVAECNLERYREVAIVFWAKALREAHDAGWERGMYAAKN